MKIDTLSLFQMFMLITLTLGVIVYIAYFFKETKVGFKKKILKILCVQNYVYVEKLAPEHYFSYMKYDIWRYCSLF